MTDIDFDELDRAVNSTYGSKDEGMSETQSVAVRQSSGRPDAQTVMDKETVPPRSPSPAMRRSSGRFMDVVHPSSDMRNSSSSAPEPRSYVRESPKAQDATPKSWQDSSSDMESDEKQEMPSTENSDSEKIIKPLESPFLSDAKVEKRPLGAFSNEVQKTSEAGQEESVKASDADETEHPIGTDTPMPAELGDDLLSIEGNESDVPVEAPSPSLSPASSIPQQYVEKPAVPDKVAVPIFNADAYHQPLAHPKKNKSGWLMVLWIFMLLIVGAGAGAAVYFYVLPMM
jgi:hypothetical protein